MEKEVPSRGYKVVVLNDIHFPNHDQKSIRAFYKFLGHKDTPKFDEVIINGDLMDYAYCSRWIKSKYRYLEGTRFKDDHDAANDWLDDFQDKCRQNNKDINFTILEGNHDKRPKDVIEANPQLAGLIEMQNSLNFEERGIFFMENWENNQLYKIGDAHFHHYPRKGGGGKHHAKGIVTRFRMNIIYGHCFDEETEILTERGWKHYDDLREEDEVMTMNKETKDLEYNKINSFHEYDNYKELYHIKGQNVDLKVTDKHGLIGYKGKYNKIDLFTADEFTDKAVRRIPNCGVHKSEGLDLDDQFLRLAVWIAADGSFENSSLVRFHLKKERKISRLTDLLEDLGIYYSHNMSNTNNHRINISMPYELDKYFDINNKYLPSEIAKCNKEQTKLLIEEYSHTDGSKTGPNSVQISTSKKEEAELLQTLFVTQGFRTNLIKRKKKEENNNWKDAYCLSINTKHIYSELKHKNISKVDYEGKVWCVNVNNGTLMVRRNGKVSITQNTHDSQLFAVSQYGEGNAVYAQSNGCMCEYRQEYLGYSPTNWQQAFSTIDFHKSGNFNHYLYQIKDNAFTTPWGKRFSGRN